MKVIARRSSPQSRTRWRRIAITAAASPATQAYSGPATRVSACSQRICVSTSISSSASPAAAPGPLPTALDRLQQRLSVGGPPARQPDQLGAGGRLQVHGITGLRHLQQRQRARRIDHGRQFLEDAGHRRQRGFIRHQQHLADSHRRFPFQAFAAVGTVGIGASSTTRSPGRAWTAQREAGPVSPCSTKSTSTSPCSARNCRIV